MPPLAPPPSPSGPDARERFAERYRSGEIPWDVADPPPEVRAFGPTLPPGRALDVGCGYGRASLFLAGLGWTVDGVDFVPEAVAEAARRAALAGVAERAHFHTADVTRLDFLIGPYDLAIDVGCIHRLDAPELRAVTGELARLIRPGGTFLLFAHLDDPALRLPDGRKWVPEGLLREVLGTAFHLTKVEHGTTTVAGNVWPSAWFWWERAAAGNDS
jgi:SAM-dependent methyltransferase